MALANKKYTRVFSTTGTDSDKIESSDLSSIESSFNSKDYIKNRVDFDKLAPLLWQIQKMQEELDELRRYVVSNEMLVVSAIGSAIPTSSKNLATGTLWNNRGLIAVV